MSSHTLYEDFKDRKPTLCSSAVQRKARSGWRAYVSRSASSGSCGGSNARDNEKRKRSKSNTRHRISVISDVFHQCVSSLPTLHNLSADCASIGVAPVFGELANHCTICSNALKTRYMENACSCGRLHIVRQNNNQLSGKKSASNDVAASVQTMTAKEVAACNYATAANDTPRRRLRDRVWNNLKSQIKQRERPSSFQLHKRIAPYRLRPSSCFEKVNATLSSPVTTSRRNELTPPNDETRFKNTGTLRRHVKDEDGSFVTFRLRVHLKCGRNLVVRDASGERLFTKLADKKFFYQTTNSLGSSDPYVKVKYRKKTIYKSNTIYRSLNPTWNEEFAFLIDDPTCALQFEVFDFDRFMVDDFMGAAFIDLSLLRLFDTHEMNLRLEEAGNVEKMGQLDCAITITPLTDAQRTQFISRAVRGIVVVTPKRPNKSIILACSVWLSTVNVVLVEARLNAELFIKQSRTAPDAYVKFKLGNEKHKSKVAARTFTPKWSEQFDLHVFEECVPSLDVMIYDKTTNSIIGRCSINLSDREKERTVETWHQLEDDSGEILLLTTISGTSSSATVVDLQEYSANRDKILQKYSLLWSLQSPNDVGYLTVKVYRAEDLAAGDTNGKSDPFCVLELVNVRLQTQTVYKTLNPEWNKIFTFSVKDVNECLQVTVFDEDPNKKFEFLGRLVIPLLEVRNCEKRWYSLRDRKLVGPAKGRILLELDFFWNPVKAALRTFNPRERKFIAPEPKFKRQLLVGSVNRLRDFGQQLMAVCDFYQSCLSWESYRRSSFALLTFVIFVYFVELWHLPLLLIILFLHSHLHHRDPKTVTRKPSVNIIVAASTPSLVKDTAETTPCDASAPTSASSSMFYDDAEAEDDANTGTQSEKTTIRTRVLAIQETLTLVQTALDFVASLLERARNTLNFTVPFLSWLAVVVLVIATVLLFFVPVRWLVMVWGINKFAKRLINPHYVDNNEILDFLSRVPSDSEYRAFYRELQHTSSVALEESAPGERVDPVMAEPNTTASSSLFASIRQRNI